LFIDERSMRAGWQSDDTEEDGYRLESVTLEDVMEVFARLAKERGERPDPSLAHRLLRGTPDIAVPTCTHWRSPGTDLCAVRTQPDRPAGRGRQVRSSA